MVAKFYEVDFRYFIDGTFFTEFPHETYTKFNGYAYRPYSESSRIDWMKTSDENEQVILSEDFNSGSNPPQIKKNQRNLAGLGTATKEWDT